jgi:hypothetical protein
MFEFLTFAVAQAASPQAVMAEIRAAREAYRQCVIEQAVKLGKGNSENAETILVAVASVCRQAEDSARTAYARAPISDSRAGTLFARDRELAQQDATAALLAARAS